MRIKFNEMEVGKVYNRYLESGKINVWKYKLEEIGELLHSRRAGKWLKEANMENIEKRELLDMIQEMFSITNHSLIDLQNGINRDRQREAMEIMERKPTLEKPTLDAPAINYQEYNYMLRRISKPRQTIFI